MITDIKDLVKPRYEVVADYPNSPHEIGILLTEELPGHYYYQDGDTNRMVQVIKIQEYPDIFKPLQWWEKRLEEEMPKYLKFCYEGKTTAYKIEKWDMPSLFGYINIEKRQGCSIMGFNPEYGYSPATEEEFEKYKDNAD